MIFSCALFSNKQIWVDAVCIGCTNCLLFYAIISISNEYMLCLFLLKGIRIRFQSHNEANICIDKSPPQFVRKIIITIICRYVVVVVYIRERCDGRNGVWFPLHSYWSKSVVVAFDRCWPDQYIFYIHWIFLSSLCFKNICEYIYKEWVFFCLNYWIIRWPNSKLNKEVGVGYGWVDVYFIRNVESLEGGNDFGTPYSLHIFYLFWVRSSHSLLSHIHFT